MSGPIKTVGIYVEDQQKAVEFYTQKLEFEIRRSQPMGSHAKGVEVLPPQGSDMPRKFAASSALTCMTWGSSSSTPERGVGADTVAGRGFRVGATHPRAIRARRRETRR